ncbi:MAG: hypothetical protein QXJ50_03910 [Candidatus Woesearchaeota archaeon]
MSEEDKWENNSQISLEEIVKNSPSFKKEVEKEVIKAKRENCSMSEKDALEIALDFLKKVENGEWKPIFYKFTQSVNDSYPAYTSIITYWGSNSLLEKIVKKSNQKITVQELVKNLKNGKNINLSAQFILPTLETKSAYEIIALAQEGKISLGEKLTPISQKVLENYLDEVGITHKMAEGFQIPWEEKRTKLIEYIRLPENLQNVKSIVEIYEKLGKSITERQALEKLEEYQRGHKDENISTYLAIEKIRQLFSKYKGKDPGFKKAYEIFQEYKNMDYVPEVNIKEKFLRQSPNVGRFAYEDGAYRKEIGHEHIEIFEMYKARKDRGGNNLIISLIAAALIALSSLWIQGITGYSVMEFENSAEYLQNFGISIVLVSAFVLAILSINYLKGQD